MKTFFFATFFTVYSVFFSQNSVRIFSSNGSLFTVTAFDSVQNEIPQTDVLIQFVNHDTLKIKVEMEDKTKLETTLYLFEKGKPTKNKEFNYMLIPEQQKIKLSYKGYYDIQKLPNPLVPKKPAVDTTFKYKNTRLGHFCELKEGKPVYYNNIPKDDICTSGMPAEYLNYTNLLMLKAQVVDDKFIIGENVCRNNCLTVEQLNFILKYIDFEIEKLKLIKIAYFNLSDKDNKKELEKAFRFESSVVELNNFFKTAVDPKSLSTNKCAVASAEEQIKIFKDELAVYSNDAQRFEIFKKGYQEFCYSKEQIRSILGVFIHDREKLDAAKMLYYQCTDKGNFLQIADIFSYGETASELKDFVSKQKD